MKKLGLLSFILFTTMLNVHGLQNQLNRLTQTLQRLANQLQPPQPFIIEPAQTDLAMRQLINIAKKPVWTQDDVNEYKSLLSIARLGGVSPALIQEYEATLAEREPKVIPKLPKPPTPKPEPKEDEKPPKVPPKPPVIVLEEPEEKERPLPPEPDEMELALEGLEEISQRALWTQADFAEFYSLLEIIKAGNAPAETIEKYTEIFAQKEERPLPAPPLPKPQPPQPPARPAPKIPAPPADGDGLPAKQAKIRPTFKQGQFRSINVFSPLGEKVPSRHEEFLTARIGIIGSGNLVVWGPQLKEVPTASTFIREDGTFIYPDTDNLVIKWVQNLVETTYHTYTLLDTSILNEQRKVFDQLHNTYNQLEQQKNKLKNLEEAHDYVNEVKIAITKIVTAFKKDPLAVSKIHPQAFNGSLTIDEAQQLLNSIKNFVTKEQDNMEKELKNAQQTKQQAFEIYKQENTPERLLGNRWERDKDYKQVREKLKVLPAILAEFKEINLKNINNLINQLELQKQNPDIQRIDTMYRVLTAKPEEKVEIGTAILEAEEMVKKMKEAPEVLSDDDVKDALQKTKLVTKEQLVDWVDRKLDQDSDWEPTDEQLKLVEEYEIDVKERREFL